MTSLDRSTKIRSLIGLFLVILIVSGSLVSLYTINSQNQTPEMSLNKASENSLSDFGKITVHISGSVSTPGVYTLAKGSRLKDALTAAGGLKEEADKAYVERSLNLAASVSDGEKIYIPTAAETGGGQPSPEMGSKSTAASPPVLGAQADPLAAKININMATIEELLNANLYRIGPKTAQKIVEYREEHGLFTEVSQIMNVPGIGEKTYEKIKDRITVE